MSEHNLRIQCHTSKDVNKVPLKLEKNSFFSFLLKLIYFEKKTKASIISARFRWQTNKFLMQPWSIH